MDACLLLLCYFRFSALSQEKWPVFVSVGHKTLINQMKQSIYLLLCATNDFSSIWCCIFDSRHSILFPVKSLLSAACWTIRCCWCIQKKRNTSAEHLFSAASQVLTAGRCHLAETIDKLMLIVIKWKWLHRLKAFFWGCLNRQLEIIC